MRTLDELALCLPALPEKLLIGLSGGADSVALTHMLTRRRKQAGINMVAVHVNHGLRGEDSDGDERFVQALCEELRLPLLIYRAVPPPHPGEDWARQARYGFYRKAMAATGAQAVALAHHRDDQAETLLLHLLRGAGLEGLAAMPADGVVLGVRVVRPLLEIPREALRSALEAEGLPWREDASNQDSRYLRNALRNEVIPLLERLAPGAGMRMAQSAAVLREAAQALHDRQEEFLRAHCGGAWLALEPVRALDKGMRKQVLRLWWKHNGPTLEERSLSHRHSEALASLPDQPVGKVCNLPGGWHAYRGFTHLHWLGPDGPAQYPNVSLTQTPFDGLVGDGRRMQAVPRALLAQCHVRFRQKGDWIRPFGGGGRQSLQDYFVNKRIDAPFRDAVPLLCRGSEVLLVAGIGAGDIPPVDDTQEMLCLRWLGDMPWLRAEQ